MLPASAACELRLMRAIGRPVGREHAWQQMGRLAGARLLPAHCTNDALVGGCRAAAALLLRRRLRRLRRLRAATCCIHSQRATLPLHPTYLDLNSWVCHMLLRPSAVMQHAAVAHLTTLPPPNLLQWRLRWAACSAPNCSSTWTTIWTRRWRCRKKM